MIIDEEQFSKQVVESIGWDGWDAESDEERERIKRDTKRIAKSVALSCRAMDRDTHAIKQEMLDVEGDYCCWLELTEEAIEKAIQAASFTAEEKSLITGAYRMADAFLYGVT